MIKKSICFICTFQLLFFYLKAQDELSLSGIVYSKSDSLPIAYALACIPEKGIGVITNEEGEFRLHFPSAFKLDTFQVRYLGFTTFSEAVAKLPLSDTLKIFLDQDAFQLAEVTVTPDSDSGKIILQEAINRLEQNFPTKLFQLNAFYREKVQNRDDYRFTRLIEGMIDVRDPGIKSNPDNIRIRLNEFRKSNNLANYTWQQSIWKALFGGEKNNLYAILLQDPIRIHFHNKQKTYKAAGKKWTVNSWNYWLGEILKNPYAFVYVANLTSYNGQKVYHLKFRYPDYYGSIFVNASDYGIHHIDYYHSVSFEHSLTFKDMDTVKTSAVKKTVETFARNMQYDEEYLGKISVEYQKLQGKYFLSYIKWLDMGDFRLSNMKKGEKTGSYNSCILMINGIQLDKGEMEKVRRRESVDKKTDINELKMKYNPDFWKSYNILLTTPLEEKVIKDLSEKESLEQQYLQNAKN